MKRLVPIILLLLVGSAALAHSSGSASYAIAGEVMGAGGNIKSSSAYGVIDVLNGLMLGEAGSSSYRMHAGFMPMAALSVGLLVTSISPSSAYNTGVVDITEIAGAGFAEGATVKLTATGEADIAATGVTVVNAGKITCKFNISGKKTGLWNLVVANIDGSTGDLPGAFNIRTWSSLTMAVNYPNPFNPMAGPTTIVYQLAADTDTALLIFNISHEMIRRWDFAAGQTGGKAGDNSITWDGYDDFQRLSANGVYLLRIVDKRSGKLLAKGKIAVSR
jgi:hypothetical protein